MRIGHVAVILVVTLVSSVRIDAQYQILPNYQQEPAQAWIDAEAYSVRTDSERLTDLLRDMEVEARGGRDMRADAREALWLAWSIYQRVAPGTAQGSAAADLGTRTEGLFNKIACGDSGSLSEQLRFTQLAATRLNYMLQSNKVPIAQPTPKPPPPKPPHY